MNFIPLARPDIHETDIAAANKVLLSGMLVQSENVISLENSISSFLGCQYTSAVSNGTASLHLALVALGIGEGDEVIVPAFSYVATANVVELVGATPVFIDIEPYTFNIDVNQIEEKINTRTKAILPVHEFGLACDMEKLMPIANKYGLFVIEDAACALGAMQNNRNAGTFGHFGSFSLHPRKAISSGEGGLLTTNNAELDKRIKVLRNHGIEIVNGKMEFTAAGFNYRLTDFQAALVNSQFQRLERTLHYKQKLADLYFSLIKNPLIKLPFVPTGMKHTWQSFHILLDHKIDRDKTIEKLKEEQIGTNYGAQCIPYQKYYQNKYKLECDSLFPNAMRAYRHGLVIPLYERLTEENIRYIASELNKL